MWKLPTASASNPLLADNLELHDEIADLDAMIGAIIDDLAPELVARNSIGHTRCRATAAHRRKQSGTVTN